MCVIASKHTLNQLGLHFCFVYLLVTTYRPGWLAQITLHCYLLGLPLTSPQRTAPCALRGFFHSTQLHVFRRFVKFLGWCARTDTFGRAVRFAEHSKPRDSLALPGVCDGCLPQVFVAVRSVPGDFTGSRAAAWKHARVSHAPRDISQRQAGRGRPVPEQWSRLEQLAHPRRLAGLEHLQHFVLATRVLVQYMWMLGQLHATALIRYTHAHKYTHT